ncbi:ProQ/FinO family protein [Bordetella sp. FB-8]|uniref:ProQ/FinO family protein n=1 Tax=Bordetella sp. FB-8 TaxID=1159870 RepID=UPI00037C4C70|nr:ProQ/FinO family protein [Bordetella sp. FB-8]
MGFEQLAALREQLAAERAAREGHGRNAQEKPVKAGKNDADKPQGAKPPQARKDGRPEGKPRRNPDAGRDKPQGQKRSAPQARAQQPEPPRDPLLVAIGRLQHAFPKAFPKKPAPRVALKLGIVQDLYVHAAKLRLSEEEIKAAIATWCSVGRYWAALSKEAVRVDLNGEPSGTVTAAEAGHASFLARQQRKKAQAAAKPSTAAPAAQDSAADSAQAMPATQSQAPAVESQASAAQAQAPAAEIDAADLSS